MFFKYVSDIIKMINKYNVFTYDRLLFIMVRNLKVFCTFEFLEIKFCDFCEKTFRSFDSTDFQLALEILNILFVQNNDFQVKFNDFLTVTNKLDLINNLKMTNTFDLVTSIEAWWINIWRERRMESIRLWAVYADAS